MKHSGLIIGFVFVYSSLVTIILWKENFQRIILRTSSTIIFNKTCNHFNTVALHAEAETNRIHKSFICDQQPNDSDFMSNPARNISFEIYRQTEMKKYCSIVATPETHWISAKNYSEKDVAFVIFTAASFYRTRATAARDTWLSRVTNYYFLSATPDPYLPVLVIAGAGEDKLSNMKKIFYGLQVIYKQQMALPLSARHKWYYIAGCDTFILPHHLLKRLDDLDYNRPIFVGGHSGRHSCLGNGFSNSDIEFPSGGAGFFLSRNLFELIQPNLTDFVENVWPRTSEISDVALACLISRFGITLTKKPGFWAHPPAFTLAEEGRERFHNDKEPNNFHYIKPNEMYALDEFYTHQHMDRLIKDQNWNELIQWTRRFVISHYELLRQKRIECRLSDVFNQTN